MYPRANKVHADNACDVAVQHHLDVGARESRTCLRCHTDRVDQGLVRDSTHVLVMSEFGIWSDIVDGC